MPHGNEYLEIDSIEDNNIAATAAKLAPRPAHLAKTGDNQVNLYALPKNYELHTDEAVRKLEDRPRRKSGSITLRTPESFADYVNLHQQPESLLYAVVDANGTPPLHLTAIFNENNHGELGTYAGWRDFRAEFTPKVAHEWAVWSKANRVVMSQSDFAIFIEDNIKDIATADSMPTGTEMLQLATKFEITSEKRVRSAIRTQSGGVDLEYVDNDDTGTTERMKSFERFQLGIPCFWQGPAYRLEARLRYRAREGKLSIWFELIRPDLVLDAAVSALVEQIKGATDATILYGTPK